MVVISLLPSSAARKRRDGSAALNRLRLNLLRPRPDVPKEEAIRPRPPCDAATARKRERAKELLANGWAIGYGLPIVGIRRAFGAQP